MLNPKLVRLSCLSFGILVFALGCALFPIFNTLIHDAIQKRVLLRNGSDTFENWKKSHGYFQVKVFDLQNPHEVINGGEKPFVNEKGVYIYKEIRTKRDPQFEDNGTITYTEEVKYEFMQNMSHGKESDIFTTVNLALIELLEMINQETSGDIIRKLTALANDSALFSQYSVQEVLWGYKDAQLTHAKKLTNISEANDGVGIFRGKNNSISGIYNIESGQNNITMLGKINSFNGLRYISTWNSKTASMINGTDGTFYHPFIKKSSVVYFFNPEMCRSFNVNYGHMTMTRGLNLYRYIMPNSVYDNNDDNDGFCTPSNNCLPSGLLNISTCRQGELPLIISQPHFYGADHFIQRHIKGLNAKSYNHQTNLDIEPKTGYVMNISKKFQVNIFLGNVRYIKKLQNIHTMYYPVLWINQSVFYNNKEINDFWNKVQVPINITEVVQYSFVVIGVVIILCVSSQFLAISFKSRAAFANRMQKIYSKRHCCTNVTIFHYRKKQWKTHANYTMNNSILFQQNMVFNDFE